MNFLRYTLFGEAICYLAKRKRDKDADELTRVESQISSYTRKSKENDVNQKEFIVTWNGENDPEHPQNWPVLVKSLITIQICLLTFSVYVGSAIFTPGEIEMMKVMHVGEVPITLGLTMFVVGYAVGPLILSPLSELPQVGRLRIYLATLFVFICLQIPTALGSSLGVLLPMRFLAGFFGSPALATGGATLADIWQPTLLPYLICIWSLGAVAGPVLGPLLGAAMVVAKDWRWQFWFLMILCAFSFIFLLFSMPETSESYLLYKRAKGLRESRGNPSYVTEGEVASRETKFSQLALETVWRPIHLSISEPIVLSLNIYIGLIYAILYLWFEAFPIVFQGVYHFTLIENGLTYMGIMVGVFIALVLFYIGLYKVTIPKYLASNGKVPPEEILKFQFAATVCFPICLFWFGWTGRASVHWMSPIASTVFYAMGTFIMFQTTFQYLASCYPKYVASVFAGNDLFRSGMAAAFPLFARAMFNNTGPSYAPVGWGCTILGVISCIMIPIPFVLYKMGTKLRTRSKFAAS
ncbi:spermine family transmembrane transporter Caf5 [Schizosaccharomyces cryophilus OY26]|uniref:Spermine family transmembrane transporter Caf5 n=1 Tax=Schizosaccharomyces cryophilus (strain OY26 / ATCC MYA-4695 / CBS 11777 / NBRC 106824 / NRRL Y48691) TaxID=653667 RepID=S9VWA6_SCHCR|nr:spermine family transmembrane transporter Caf5 [Schizosaccharomyces cryophilus OY26]EPY51908.1 spermine family transmembrane transporter Caf5 [Schizosaccharomyces cryophilus OY26]